VRRHAKASTAGSTQRQAGRLGGIVRGAFATRGPSSDADGSGAPSAGPAAALALGPGTLGARRGRPLFVAACAALVALAYLLSPAAPPSAVAGTVSGERPFLFAFDGSGSSVGRFPGGAVEAGSAGANLGTIAVDNASGAVYVAYESSHFAVGNPGFVCKFGVDGAALSFAATGESCLAPNAGSFHSAGVAVDNSSVNESRIYVSDRAAQRLDAFDPNGTNLWGLSPDKQSTDVAVDPSGHPWLVPSSSPNNGVQRFDSSGSPPALLCSFPLEGGGYAIEVDSQGNLYVGQGGIQKYVGGCAGTFDSTLDPDAFDVYADQSSPTGHLFTIQGDSFAEYDSAGALLDTYGADYVQATFSGGSLAYDPSLDRVYVSQKASFADPTPVVAVFGPPTSGTVPDVTELADPASVGISTAHFEGTVNPKNTASKAHFEWKTSDQSWAAADLLQSSTPQALTANETPQTVEFDTNRLRGNTTYEVRLVTVNDADDLRAFSTVKTFTTAEALAAPEVTIDPVGSVGTTTATVEGTVNPKGDTADWRVQLQQGCEGSFSNRPLRTIAEGSEAPVAVEDELTGLLPSERYCAQISATNSAGTTISAVEEFETDPVEPSEVEAAFAAPRTDTTARINGRLNPEGHAITYRFEYSTDGGASWIALPDREDTSESRIKLLVSEELTGLSPDTPYSYRLVAENEAGSVQSEAKSFTTRPTPVESPCPNAEIRATQHSAYLPDCRAFELVNNPDKGNQDAGVVGGLAEPTSPNGEVTMWKVTAGAPGGNITSNNEFAARRTLSGWRSSPIAPPADRQEGRFYEVLDATPDLSTFIAQTNFRAADNATTLVRIDADQNQQLLSVYPEFDTENPLDPLPQMTDDGAHVFALSPERQVQEIGDGEEPAEVVSIQPDGEPSECGASFQLEGLSSTGFAYDWIDTVRGSRVYFQAKPNGACDAPRRLYVRNRDTGETTLIDPTPAGDGMFIRATLDGHSAYFATNTPLDPADKNASGDVYRWDEEQGASTCLTCEAHPEVGIGSPGSALPQPLVSDDFSHVYFEGDGGLTPESTPGHTSIYSLSDGELHLVSEVIGEPNLMRRGKAEVSADGNTLVFESMADPRLTSDQFAPACEGACFAIYRYDDHDGSLECVSCRSEGVNSRAAELNGLSAMSKDGSTITFTTAEALLPLDVNQSPDIYRWREGSVELVTDGVSELPLVPRVVDVDDDGSDIFFLAAFPGLTGFEHDGTINMYDARVGGGFDPPTPPALCTEDSCQGPLQAAPNMTQPASAGFDGRGNAEEAKRKRRPCARKRGKVRKRCLRRHRKARARANARRAK
jgi:hypothetical protein